MTTRMNCGSTIRCAGLREADGGDQDRQQHRGSGRAALHAAALRRGRLHAPTSAGCSGVGLHALDMRGVVVRQLAGAVERTRPPAGSGSTSGRSRAGSPDRRSTSALRGRSTAARSATSRRRNDAPKAATMAVNSAPHSRPKMITRLRELRRQHVHQHVDADVDAGAHAVGGAELGHPDEHVDAEFLRPGQVAGGEPLEDGRQDRRRGSVRPCAVDHLARSIDRPVP